jgi:pikachurin
VKSEETVVLNQWNTITIFRHRWDAWLILNQGNRIQGRSKVRWLVGSFDLTHTVNPQGLFSRITFREPVFLGGTGNITGLAKKLPTTDGMVGCVRKFIANEHEYNFDSMPYGDVTQGFDIREYHSFSFLFESFAPMHSIYI